MSDISLNGLVAFIVFLYLLAALLLWVLISFLVLMAEKSVHKRPWKQNYWYGAFMGGVFSLGTAVILLILMRFSSPFRAIVDKPAPLIAVGHLIFTICYTLWYRRKLKKKGMR